MIHWHSRIYIGSKIRNEYEKIRKSLEEERSVPGIYVITLSSNPIEQLDIYTSAMFISSLKYNPNPVIVAAAKGKGEAWDLLKFMAFDVYCEKQAENFRAYFADE